MRQTEKWVENKQARHRLILPELFIFIATVIGELCLCGFAHYVTKYSHYNLNTRTNTYFRRPKSINHKLLLAVQKKRKCNLNSSNNNNNRHKFCLVGGTYQGGVGSVWKAAQLYLMLQHLFFFFFVATSFAVAMMSPKRLNSSHLCRKLKPTRQIYNSRTEWGSLSGCVCVCVEYIWSCSAVQMCQSISTTAVCRLLPIIVHKLRIYECQEWMW